MNLRRATHFLKKLRRQPCHQGISSLEGTGRNLKAASGFTLLEVLVALTLLAIGVAITLSLISGSLGNIRKVQLRTRTVEHAEAVMELALLDESGQQLSGDFEDGTRWTVRVDPYELPVPPQQFNRALPQNMPVKLLRYTVEMFSPGSMTSDYHLQTLKMVKITPEDQAMRPPQ